MLLRAEYDKIGDEMTRLRYENESLKDHQEEREEEVSYIILVKLILCKFDLCSDETSEDRNVTVSRTYEDS